MVQGIAASNAAPALQGQAITKARELFSGLRQPAGVGAQLSLAAQQQLAQGAAPAMSQQGHPIAMAHKALAALAQAHLLCEAPARGCPQG